MNTSTSKILVSRWVGYKICSLENDASRSLESERFIAEAARMQLREIAQRILSGDLVPGEEEDALLYTRADIERFL